MKVSVEKFNLDSGLNLVRAFEDLGLKTSDLDSFVTPVMITTIPHFTYRKMISFYPTVLSHITSLTICGFKYFRDFVNSYNEATHELETLVERINSYEADVSNLINSISSVLEFFKDNRDCLEELVVSFKTHRPSALTKDIDGFNNLKFDGIDKFFVCTISNLTPTAEFSSVYSLEKNSVIVSGYNLTSVQPIASPSEYKEILSEYTDKVEEHCLSLVSTMMNRRFKFKTKFDSFNVVYDLVAAVYERWGVC